MRLSKHFIIFSLILLCIYYIYATCSVDLVTWSKEAGCFIHTFYLLSGFQHFTCKTRKDPRKYFRLKFIFRIFKKSRDKIDRVTVLARKT